MPTDRVPQVGEVWRERRHTYEKRTARVVEVDGCDGTGNGFVYLQTLTNYQGKPTKPRKPTRVRLSTIRSSWMPA